MDIILPYFTKWVTYIYIYVKVENSGESVIPLVKIAIGVSSRGTILPGPRLCNISTVGGNEIFMQQNIKCLF